MKTVLADMPNLILEGGVNLVRVVFFSSGGGKVFVRAKLCCMKIQSCRRWHSAWGTNKSVGSCLKPSWAVGQSGVVRAVWGRLGQSGTFCGSLQPRMGPHMGQFTRPSFGMELSWAECRFRFQIGCLELLNLREKAGALPSAGFLS